MGNLNNTWTFNYAVDVLFVFKEQRKIVITGLSICQECACAGRLVVDGPSLEWNGYLIVCSYGIVNFVELEPCRCVISS